VVTAEVGGERVGLTMNSFASLSLDPPLILWSIGKTSRSYAAFSTARHFAINVLSAKQVAVSRAFTNSAATDKFAGIAWSPGRNGAPVLDGAVAVVECERDVLYPGGDHLIIVGRVKHFDTFPGDGLLFAQGRYAIALDHPETGTPSAILDRDAKAPTELPGGKLFNSLYWTFNSMSEKFAVHRQEAGLNLPQTRVLLQLYSSPNISFEQLLRQTYLSRSVCEEAVDALLGNAEVIGDARGFLSLSNKGRAHREALAQKEREFERRLTAGIAANDITITRSVLDTITARLQA
jgi:flavin reductase (DIM6/NTAB) family NADH-FMN oxidoreductase RutF/DNA-binding MarR family transcriptional regulator